MNACRAAQPVRSGSALCRASDVPAADPGREVRIGMVGGAAGAGIAPAHRYAMRLDGRYDVVAVFLSPRRSVRRH